MVFFNVLILTCHFFIWKWMFPTGFQFTLRGFLNISRFDKHCYVQITWAIYRSSQVENPPNLNCTCSRHNAKSQVYCASPCVYRITEAVFRHKAEEHFGLCYFHEPFKKDFLILILTCFLAEWCYYHWIMRNILLMYFAPWH